MVVSGAKLTADVLVGLEQFIAAHGLDAPDIIRRFSLDDASRPRGEHSISLDMFAQMLEFLANATGDDAIGLRFALASQSQPVGLLFHLAASSATWGEAIATRVRYADLVSTGYRLELQDRGSTTRLIWRFVEQLPPHDQYIDYSLTYIFERSRALLGGAWPLQDARIGHAPPRARGEFDRIFGCPIQFGGDETWLAFATETLSVKLPHADPSLAAALERAAEAERRAAASGASFPDLVGAMIARTLAHERSGIDSLAHQLGLSRRSLQRRLEAEGVSYRALVDQVRRKIARYLLLSSDMPMIDIGAQLGFSDPSAFSRAAREWFGAPPNRIRAESRVRKTDALAPHYRDIPRK